MGRGLEADLLSAGRECFSAHTLLVLLLVLEVAKVGDLLLGGHICHALGCGNGLNRNVEAEEIIIREVRGRLGRGRVGSEA